MKVYHDFGQTMIGHDILRAFRVLGLEFDVRNVPYRLLFDEIRLIESAGCWDLLSVDFPLDQLSSQRRTARFAWTNKPE
jgi:hypothetical protein